MNLVGVDFELREKILIRAEQIGFFVYEKDYFWIIDWDENFNLNYMINIEALCQDSSLMQYLPVGKSVEEYKSEVIQRYRGGIPILTSELFPQYKRGASAKVVTTEMLRQEFFAEDEHQYSKLSTGIEKSLSFNESMSEELIKFRMRLFSMLPKFYINYDRKIFMHMVRDRSYEAVVLDGWWGAQGDFEHMIPTSHRYWVRNIEEDFWAVTNFSNSL